MKTATEYHATLDAWRFRNHYPFKETRFKGQPHECLAICTEGLLAVECAKLFDLSDYAVSAVCGPFTELKPRK